MIRVLVTRSSHQASELAGQLRSAGLHPVLVASIEVCEPTSFAALDTAIAHLEAFHWLLFTSANAVQAFHRRLHKIPASDPPLPGSSSLPAPYYLFPASCRIASIGPATSRAVEQLLGKIPGLRPPMAVAESLAEALRPHAHQPDGTPTRFLLIRAEQARDHLPDTLRAAGAEVTVAPAYRTIIPESSIAAIRDLFQFPASYPDAITFTSSSTATNLLALLHASGLTLPTEVPRVSIGPITSQTLRDLNLPPHAEAAEPTIASLVLSIVKCVA